MKKILTYILIAFYSCLASAAEVSLPKELSYKDATFVHAEGWEDYEEIRYADITGNGSDEAIARVFMREGSTAVPTAFTLIYELVGDRYEKVVTFRGGEYLGGMDIVDINNDSRSDIVLYDHTGNHYTVISVFIYDDGRYRQVFENGTACFLYDVVTDDGPTRILIGRENWADKDFVYANSTEKSLKEVWVWDGREFKYSGKLSTTKPVSERRAIDMSVYKMCSLQEEGAPPTEEEIKGYYDQNKWTFRRWIAGSRAYYIFRDQLDEVYDKRL